MATVLLIRHAHWEGVGRVLAGRLKGIRLSPEGVAQARRGWLTKENVLNTRPWREIAKLRA